MGMFKRKYKTITIRVSLSEFNHDYEHSINELTTKIINKATKSINTTVKRHNRFKDYKIDLDSIESYTFPNNIENNK